jgi:hypothetical protein
VESMALSAQPAVVTPAAAGAAGSTAAAPASAPTPTPPAPTPTQPAAAAGQPTAAGPRRRRALLQQQLQGRAGGSSRDAAAGPWPAVVASYSLPANCSPQRIRAVADGFSNETLYRM